MMNLNYFTPEEFQKCNPPCKITDMNEDFLLLLDKIRAEYGKPITINCAYRSPEYDKKQGRSGNSAHTRGLAVDIKCISSSNRAKLLHTIINNGVNRIGISPNFIHIDIDKSLPQDVIWTY